jgi:flap endonuclease-1
MGIKSLMKAIKKLAPDAITKIRIDSLNYKVMAIDASGVIYAYVIGLRNTGSDFADSDGKISSHIMAVFYKTLAYLRRKIIPIYVFDGAADVLKLETLKDRKERRLTSEKKLQGKLDEREKIQEFKKGFRLTRTMVAEIKELLTYMGISWIQALGEADPQCARLTQVPGRTAYGVISEDTDMIALGADRTIRNLNSKSKYAEMVEYRKVLDGMDLSAKRFVEFCILLGCDYLPTISGVGPVKAYDIVSKEGGVRNWLAKQKKKPVSSAWLERFLRVREHFLKPVTIEPEIADPSWNKPDTAKVEELLNRFGFGNAWEKAAELELIYNIHCIDWNKRLLEREKKLYEGIEQKLVDKFRAADPNFALRQQRVLDL